MDKRPTELIPARQKITEVRTLKEPILKLYRYCSLKLDGHWTAVHVDVFGNVSAWTRNNNNITEKVSHNRWFHAIQSYVTTEAWIIGELWQKNVHCSSLTTFLAERRPLRFSVFKVRHLKRLEYVEEYCSRRSLDCVPFIINPRDGQLRSNLGIYRHFNHLTLQEFFDRRVLHPADGLVFSDDEKVSLLKWKPERTIDLIYMGFNYGKGKYAGTVGNIVLRTAEGQRVARASGMSDSERNWILNHSEELKGRVVEISYKSITAKGRLRHPAFKRFRTDKMPEECSVRQDPELAKYYGS